MSVMIGNKDVLAFEWEYVDSDEFADFVLFCLWVYGEQIGVYDDCVMLQMQIPYVELFLAHRKDRWLPELADMTKEEVFALLFDEYIYTVPPGESLSDYLNDPTPEKEIDSVAACRMRDIFYLNGVGAEPFRDRTYMVLVDDPIKNVQRMIWRERATMEMKEVQFPMGTVDKVAEQYLESLRAPRTDLA